MILSRRTTPTGKEPAAKAVGCEERPTYSAVTWESHKLVCTTEVVTHICLAGEQRYDGMVAAIR